MGVVTGAAYADLTTLARDLHNASGLAMDKAAETVIKSTALQVEALAKQKAPRDTGALADSIDVVYPSKLEAVISPHVDYGPAQEFGARPHIIRPKKPGGYLVFQKGGKTVFAREVHHPGNRAQPYMRPALEAALGPAQAELMRVGALLITKGKVGA